jgi:hypothetical protein
MLKTVQSSKLFLAGAESSMMPKSVKSFDHPEDFD